MDQSELKYAIRVDEHAFFIRFYCWLYEADKSSVNFCKLFWAYVFVAPALCGRGFFELALLIAKSPPFVWKGLLLLGIGVVKITLFVTKPLVWVTDTSIERNEARVALAKERQAAAPPKVPRPRPKVMQSALGGVEHGGTIAIMRYKSAMESAAVVRAAVHRTTIAAGRTTVRVANQVGAVTSTPLVGRALLVLAACLSGSLIVLCAFWIAPVVGFLFNGMGEGISAAASGTREGVSAAAYDVTHSQGSLWALLGVVAIVVLVCFVMGIIAIGVPYLLVKYVLEPVGRPVAKVGVGGAKVIDSGMRGFGQVMYLGYYAVKTSTCPRIEVEKRPDHKKIKQMEEEVGIR